MTYKDTYFIVLSDSKYPEISGVGECALFRGLSAEDTPAYESILDDVCKNINLIKSVQEIPLSSIRMGIETAQADLYGGGKMRLWASQWSDGIKPIRINGLVWMGDKETMLKRVMEKLELGFRCIKIKIGGIDFYSELKLIEALREIAPGIELRLDANGAFTPKNALDRLEKLAKYDIHSLEQPIKQGQWTAMREITRNSPIPIALDEELIGCSEYDHQCRLLDATRPQYVILKPSLCGGFSNADSWIKQATDREAGWWATSSLESNIGLNAIAQWVATKHTAMPQGLGTGQIYLNNIASPIKLDGERLSYDINSKWDLAPLGI